MGLRVRIQCLLDEDLAVLNWGCESMFDVNGGKPLGYAVLRVEI
jgi:hypothetical protein